MRFLKSGDWLENAIQVQMSTTELDMWKRRSSLTPVEIAVNEGSQTIAHYFLVGSSGVRMVVYEDKN